MYGMKKAAIKLHNKLLCNILRQPMRFFESTPVGRLLSRFSCDINIIDVRLPYYSKIVAPYGFRVRAYLVKHALSCLIANKVINPFTNHFLFFCVFVFSCTCTEVVFSNFSFCSLCGCRDGDNCCCQQSP